MVKIIRRIENGTTTYKDANLVKFFIGFSLVIGVILGFIIR